MLEMKQYSDEEIMRNLPHSEARRGQIAAIRFALESWDSGKRFVIIEAPTGAGKCLAADTLILLSDGRRIPIGDLGDKIGCELHSINGNLQNTSCRLLSHQYSGQQECYRILTHSGRSIIATKNHNS